MNAVTEVVRSLLALLVAGEWTGLDRMTTGSRLSADDVRSGVAAYGRTLVMPPKETFDELDVVEVSGAIQRTVNVRVPFWTVEEGRSDLELVLTLSEVADGLWSVHVDDLLVP